jgi:hypothetical protein
MANTLEQVLPSKAERLRISGTHKCEEGAGDAKRLKCARWAEIRNL